MPYRYCNIFLIILTMIPIPGLTQCTYRFTNYHIALPKSMHSIAIEAVYDTSKETIPHELLWQALQREFARDGRLFVTSHSAADLLLRAHVQEAHIRPSGAAQEVLPVKDLGSKDNPSEPPENYRILTRAGRFVQQANISLRVHVEIIDLYSHKVLFSKIYTGFQSFRAARSEENIQKKTHFLFYQEALETKLGVLSQGIAQNVVRDFIVSR